MPIPREQLRMTDQELAELLRDARTLRAGTVSPDGWPHVVPLWFVWHEGAIWVNNLRRSRRTRDLEAGSNVAMCIDLGEQYAELRGAVLYGTPQVVPGDSEELDAVRRLFGDKYFGGRDGADRKSHDWLRMDPERIVTWDYRKIPAGRDDRAELTKRRS